jgi:alkyl sulfatase BDS1-like metallo-beta-lactamase superfamily hydrolase
VTEGVYQIRNLDLSNMTIIEGKEGITVVDPLVSAEPQRSEWICITKIAAISRSLR